MDTEDLKPATIELLAGIHPNGQAVVEQLQAVPQEEAASFLLLKSPMFVRGIARGDVIKQLDKPKGAFQVLRHGGNLCIRLFKRDGIEELRSALAGRLEKLGAELDIAESSVLVYSLHVSCGFQAVESLLDEVCSAVPDSQWLYGNVYDPESGEPLNWWQPILAPD